MKYLKMLGLAAVAALALMAVMGAGTASAKVCSNSGAGASCGTGHGNEYTGAVTATTTEAKLTSGFINVTCHSHASGSITNSATGTGSISELSFTGCVDNFGRTCTAATTGRPYHASVVVSTKPNGTMTVSNVAGEFTCKNPFNTAENVTCKYATPTATTTVTGGAPAKITATGVKLSRQTGSHALCSSEASWHGTYTVSTPASLFIT
jgi:hypothetical protein